MIKFALSRVIEFAIVYALFAVGFFVNLAILYRSLSLATEGWSMLDAVSLLQVTTWLWLRQEVLGGFVLLQFAWAIGAHNAGRGAAFMTAGQSASLIAHWVVMHAIVLRDGFTSPDVVWLLSFLPAQAAGGLLAARIASARRWSYRT